MDSSEKFFEFVGLQYTSSCTLGCDFCNLSCGKEGETIKDSAFKSLIKEISDFGCSVLLITGGEIFEKSSRLLELLSRSPQAQRNIGEIVLQTNGVHLSDEKLKRLKDIPNLSCIELSFHERMNPELAVRAERNIAGALELSIPLHINYIVDSTNGDNILALLQKHHQIGAASFHFLRFGPEGLGKEQRRFVPSYTEWLGFLGTLHSVQQGNRQLRLYTEPGMIDLGTFMKNSLYRFGACSNERKVIITADGNVTDCFFSGGRLGSLYNDSFSRIIAGRKPVRRDTVEEGCPECENYSICEGGCRLYSNTRHEPALKAAKIIPLCPIAQVAVSDLGPLLGKGVSAMDPVEIYSKETYSKIDSQDKAMG